MILRRLVKRFRFFCKRKLYITPLFLSEMTIYFLHVFLFSIDRNKNSKSFKQNSNLKRYLLNYDMPQWSQCNDVVEIYELGQLKSY